jgi:hypothetical protein
MPHPFRRYLAIAVIAFVLLPSLPACSTAPAQGLQMLPASSLPAELRVQPATVREAYQFAAANPELMQQMPCYCGCGSIGHTSNYSCYISSTDSHGNITFDSHAEGCSICVDITQDVMRLSRQGRSAGQIRAYVDDTYSQFGTSNLP